MFCSPNKSCIPVCNLEGGQTNQKEKLVTCMYARRQFLLSLTTLSVATFISISNIPFPNLDMLFVLERPKTFHLGLLKVDADMIENWKKSLLWLHLGLFTEKSWKIAWKHWVWLPKLTLSGGIWISSSPAGIYNDGYEFFWFSI